MAINVADGFQYLGKKSLDARTSYATLAAMKAVADANINEGCFAFCEETDKYYTFKSTNTVDADTGKWREFSSGGNYTAGDGIIIDENAEISTDAMQEGDMDDVIPELPVVTPQDMAEICDPLPVAQGRADFKVEHNILFYKGSVFMALANIDIYVDSSTGVDDYDGGYGFSDSTPFKTIQYAMTYLPHHSKNGQEVRLTVGGTFTASQYSYYFDFYNFTNVVKLYIKQNTVFNNIGVRALGSPSVYIQVATSCTFNVTDTTLVSRTAWGMIFWIQFSTLYITNWGGNKPTITVVGNATSKARIRGFSINTARCWANITFNISQATVAIQAEQCASGYVDTVQGSNLNASITAYHGSTVGFQTNSTGVNPAGYYGGRYYTGNQS